MDKNTLIGIFLIGAILLTFNLMKDDEPEEEAKTEETTSESESDSKEESVAINIVEESAFEPDSVLLLGIADDSLRNDPTYAATYLAGVKAATLATNENKAFDKFKKKYGVFAPAAAEQETTYTTLENDKLIVRISSKGGRIVSTKMKEYQSYIDYTANAEGHSAMALFEEETSSQSLDLVNAGIPMNTAELNFVSQAADTMIVAAGEDKATVTYRLKTEDADSYIDFKYTLENGSYDVNYTIEYVNLQGQVDLSDVQLKWQMKGLATEKLTSDERMIATTMYRYMESKRDYLSEKSTSEADLEATTNWVAFKHKFFTSAIISEDGWKKGKVAQVQEEDDKYTVDYSTTLELPATNIVKMKFFFGPNDYKLLDSYENGMGDIINHGWGIFGWVNKWLIRPIFNVFNSWGLGIGLIIILVTLVVKIIITPLTYKNYLSSAKTRVIKPETDRINEKFAGKDKMMERQKAISELHRSTGVNPMAGCIPMLIQMPILLAVFRFFPSSLELRQKAFLWADDMSSYDSIYSWTGDIPVLSSIYGNHISLFTLMMAASTMVYTIMNSNNMAQPTQPGMPNMKYIMYFFPIMMIFFFNQYSAGLSFYYLCGNLFNIGIMYGIKKFFIDEDKIRLKIEQNKLKPAKRKSKLMQRMEDAQKQAAVQQKNKKKK